MALDIEVEAERFQQAVQRITDEYVKRVSVPGFRKGRAPRQLALRYVNWDLVNRHAADEVIGEAVDELLHTDDELQLFRAVEPDDVTDVKYPEGDQPLRFTVLVTTKPKVQLGPYKGLRFEYTPVEVTEQDVHNAVEDLLFPLRDLKTLEKPVEKGDWVYVRRKGGDEFEQPKLLIADSDLSPNGDKLIGLQAGDEVTLSLTGESDEGETYTVVEVKNWVLPELTDEVAQQVGEYSSAQDLLTAVRRRLEERAAHIAERGLEEQILRTVVDSSTVVVPDEVVESVAADRMAELVRVLEEEGSSLDAYLLRTKRSYFQLQQEMRASAERGVKAYFVCRAIAEAEGLTITSDEDEVPTEGVGDQGEGGSSRGRLADKVIEFLKANNEIVNTAVRDAGGSQ